MNLKELAAKPDTLVSGHRLCPGCGQVIAARLVAKASDYPIVIANATGCLEVSTTIYPFSAWNIPWIHNAFENAAATISGVEAAYRFWKKKGKTTKDIKFVAFGGDGGTYDIGFQSLSGAMERGHQFAYFCFDNEGYMNTGIQRSSATPYGADTKTTPAGKTSPGKTEFKKDMAAIAAAHHIPYVAQATMANIPDLIMKAKKAIEANGPAFVVVLSPCMPGWEIADNQAVELAKLAVETNFWPLYEIENGVWKLNYEPAERKPITEWMGKQGRFKHLFKEENKPVIDKIQANVDSEFARIKSMCSLKPVAVEKPAAAIIPAETKTPAICVPSPQPIEEAKPKKTRKASTAKSPSKTVSEKKMKTK